MALGEVAEALGQLHLRLYLAVMAELLLLSMPLFLRFLFAGFDFASHPDTG